MATLHINAYYQYLVLNNIKMIVGDLSKLPSLENLQNKDHDYRTGYFYAVSGAKGDLLQTHFLCNGAFMAGWGDAKKAHKNGEIFVIKQRYNKAFILKCQKDGDSFCCFGTEFSNLQESSDYSFGPNYYSAVRCYIDMKNAQLEMQNNSEQKFKVVSKLELAEKQIKDLSRKLLCAESYEKQLRTEFQAHSDKLNEQIKELQSKLQVAENQIKNESERVLCLISENERLKETNSVWAKQLSNYETTTKMLLEENRQLKSSINFNVVSDPSQSFGRAMRPTLPKISDDTLKRLVEKYNDSKKSVNTFDSWLVSCVIEAYRVCPKQLSDDTFETLHKIHKETNSFMNFEDFLLRCTSDYEKVKKFDAVLRVIQS